MYLFFFSWLSLPHLFLFILCLITFGKPFGIASVMICWLSNGEGPLGWGGCQHYKPSVVGGVNFKIKILQWGGGRLINDGFTKNWPAPPHPLINNDWPLITANFLKIMLFAIHLKWIPADKKEAWNLCRYICPSSAKLTWRPTNFARAALHSYFHDPQKNEIRCHVNFAPDPLRSYFQDAKNKSHHLGLLGHTQDV